MAIYLRPPPSPAYLLGKSCDILHDASIAFLYLLHKPISPNTTYISAIASANKRTPYTNKQCYN